MIRWKRSTSEGCSCPKPGRPGGRTRPGIVRCLRNARAFCRDSRSWTWCSARGKMRSDIYSRKMTAGLPEPEVQLIQLPKVVVVQLDLLVQHLPDLLLGCDR